MAHHRVLLIEDSDFLGRHVQETLEDEHDMSISIETTAEDAKEALRSGAEFDCILINYDLPDATGIEFSDSLSDELPIILFTSKNLQDIASRALESGATAFIHKSSLEGTMDVPANRIDLVIRSHA